MRGRGLSLTVLLPGTLFIAYLGVYLLAFPVYQHILMTFAGAPLDTRFLAYPIRVCRSRWQHRLWLPAAWVEESLRPGVFGFQVCDGDEVEALGLDPLTRSRF